MPPVKAKILTLLGTKRQTGAKTNKENDVPKMSYARKKSLKQLSVLQPTNERSYQNLSNRHGGLTENNDYVNVHHLPQNGRLATMETVRNTCTFGRLNHLVKKRQPGFDTCTMRHGNTAEFLRFDEAPKTRLRSGDEKLLKHGIRCHGATEVKVAVRKSLVTKEQKEKNQKVINSNISTGNPSNVTQVSSSVTNSGDTVSRYMDDYVHIRPMMGTRARLAVSVKKTNQVSEKSQVSTRNVLPSVPKFLSLEERCKFYWDKNLESDSDFSSDDEDVEPERREKRKIGRHAVRRRASRTDARVELCPKVNIGNTCIRNDKDMHDIVPMPLQLEDHRSIQTNSATCTKLVDYPLSDTESIGDPAGDYTTVSPGCLFRSRVGRYNCEDDAMESFMDSRLVHSDSDEGLSSMNSEDFYGD